MKKNHFVIILAVVVALGLVMQTRISTAAEQLDLQNLPDSPNWQEGKDIQFFGKENPWAGYKSGINPKFQNQEIINAWGYGASQNFEEIKDLIPPTLYEILKHPEIWGDFRINETKGFPWEGELFKKYQDYTEKYKGTCKVSDDNELLNYKAGLPFPEPKTADEVIWNFIKRFRADDRWMYGTYALLDRDGHNRTLASNNLMFYFDGRLKCPPAPIYTPNPNGIDYILTFPYIAPYDLKGTIPLIYRYPEADKQDDMWMYSPYLRRVRRMSAAQRQDRTPGGMDVLWDSFEFFYGKPSNYTWTLLERKEMLAPSRGVPLAQVCVNGYTVACNTYFQRKNMWVIKGTSKNPVSCRDFILYIDPEMWFGIYGMITDAKGRDWLWNYYSQTAGNDWIPVPHNMLSIDVQRRHATRMLFRGDEYNSGHEPGELTMGALMKNFPAR